MSVHASADQVLAALAEYITARGGSRRVAAIDLGISPEFLTQLLTKRCYVTERVARKLGFDRTVIYTPKGAA